MSTPEIRAMCLPLLALPLLVTRVVADHPDHAAAPDDLALFADRLHARPNLHLNPRPYLLVPIGDPTPVEVVRSDLDLHLVPRQNSDAVHPHLPRAVRQYLVSVLQLDAEHGIGQWLDHCAFEHDGIFLGLGQVTLLIVVLLCAAPGHTGGARPERVESGVAAGQSVPMETDQAPGPAKYSTASRGD